MTSLLRKLTWWRQRRRKEDQLREELEFHLAQEAEERQAGGVPEDQARRAARRDLGNLTLLRELAAVVAWRSGQTPPRPRGGFTVISASTGRLAAQAIPRKSIGWIRGSTKFA